MRTIFLKPIYVFLIACIFLTGCTIIRPGEVGLLQRLGKIKGKPILAGVKGYNAFTTKVIKINVRTVEIYETLELPTKEGLSVKAQITLLYHVKAEMVEDVYTNFGPNYEEVFVKSNFLATAREVSARYYAKELYAIDRELVETVIMDELSQDIDPAGFAVVKVLLKDIILPEAMVKAIQDKVNAEQASLMMDFVISKQKKEAERLIIEAEGIRQSQAIIDSSLTDQMIKYTYLQVMKGLITSPNTKVVVSNGDMPVILGDGAK
jgi:prohibitin 1